MAVELCKVSLWLEALEPGKPLSFLDAHIKCGNSLVGTTPDLVSAGVPDAAFESLDGDDPKTARGLRDRNAKERIGQLGFTDTGLDFDITGLATSWARLETMDESSVEHVQQKEREYRRLLESPEARQQRRAADAWCAAFFTLKSHGMASITSASIRSIASTDGHATTATDRVVGDALADVGTFQWPLEFPDVFASGGFDVVLGNPPWETLSPDAKEFFAVYDPGVRNVGPREQKAIIDRLLQDPVIEAGWDAYCWRLYRLANFLRKGGRYRLFAPGNLGKGDFNVYRIFVELALQLTRDGGRAAQIVPDGFYLGANASALRRALVGSWQWGRVYGFENTREVWFKDIDTAAKFCIYSARKGGTTRAIEVAFGSILRPSCDESGKRAESRWQRTSCASSPLRPSPFPILRASRVLVSFNASAPASRGSVIRTRVGRSASTWPNSTWAMTATGSTSARAIRSMKVGWSTSSTIARRPTSRPRPYCGLARPPVWRSRQGRPSPVVRRRPGPFRPTSGHV